MLNDYFRSRVYRFILRLSFAQGSVGLVKGSGCPKSFVS